MDEIEQLKAKEKEQEKMGYETPADYDHNLYNPAGVEEPGRTRRRKGPSLFGPVFLIGLGGYFLLTNLGVIDGELNWHLLSRWWPLFLIFAGLNVLVRAVRGPAGSCLSGVVGLAAALTFGGLLLFGDQLPFLNSAAGSNIQTQEIAVDRQEASQAEVELEFSEADVLLTSLNDSPLLLSGRVNYQGELFLEESLRGDRLELGLDLDEDDSRNFTSNLNQSTQAPWELALNDQVAINLELHLDSGRAELDLRDLTLTDLVINGSSGDLVAWLPAGEYKTHLFAGSGTVELYLPEEALSTSLLEIEAGTGPLNVYLPASLPVKMELEEEVGRKLSSGDFHYEAEYGWVTNNFDPDVPYLELDIDVSSGAVNIEIE